MNLYHAFSQSRVFAFLMCISAILSVPKGICFGEEPDQLQVEIVEFGGKKHAELAVVGLNAKSYLRLIPEIDKTHKIHSMSISEVGQVGSDHFKLIKQLRSLETLTVHKCSLPDENPVPGDSKCNIQRVVFVRSAVGSRLLRQLAVWRRLNSLSFYGVKQIDIGILTANRSLEHLGITDFELRENDMKLISQLTQLESIALDGNAISDSGLEHLKALKSLRSVTLSSNPITDSGLLHLGELKKLQGLDIQNTKVTRNGVDKLMRRLPEVLSNVVFLKSWEKAAYPAEVTTLQLPEWGTRTRHEQDYDRPPKHSRDGPDRSRSARLSPAVRRPEPSR